MVIHDLERIEQKLDKVTVGAIAVNDSVGGVAFTSMSEMLEFAKLLSLAGTSIPKHLRGNPGGCLAITIQALEWRMSPISVANQSYEVNDKIAYMSQLIHAVVEARAPLKQRLRCRYEGDADQRRCIITAHFRGEIEAVEYESPAFGKITPKSSPLWKSDPDQQQFYYSVRAFARRFCPDVLLGIYSEDELRDTTAELARDITPKPNIASRLKGAEGKRGFNKAGVENALEHKPSEVIDAGKVKPEPVHIGNDPELPASLDRRTHEQADELAEWLDEQIAIANNLKTADQLDELDPRVWKRLRESNRAKDLGEKWETEGFNPNMNRLDPARKAKK